jgi:hypothetical protein
MAQFTIRVELHKASWDDYVKLAAALARQNITDVLTIDTGERWKMPPGEYQCHGELTPKQVHDIVQTAVGTTGRTSAIIVTQSAGRYVSGTSSQA